MHTYEAEKGDSIWIAANKAVQFAKNHNERITLSFNDEKINVHPASFDEDIAYIYILKHSLPREI